MKARGFKVKEGDIVKAKHTVMAKTVAFLMGDEEKTHITEEIEISTEIQEGGHHYVEKASGWFPPNLS